ncbi:MAG: hypothetical protein WBP58_09050 [Chitinophagaceae bacterium]
MQHNAFKFLLVVMAVLVLVYTGLAMQKEGGDLFSVFFANIKALGWNGQFNLDFSCYLLLSGLWIMWRNRFSGTSIVIGLIASILGIIFFAPYLLWSLYQAKGDLKMMLIGKQ